MLVRTSEIMVSRRFRRSSTPVSAGAVSSPSWRRSYLRTANSATIPEARETSQAATNAVTITPAVVQPPLRCIPCVPASILAW